MDLSRLTRSEIDLLLQGLDSIKAARQSTRMMVGLMGAVLTPKEKKEEFEAAEALREAKEKEEELRGERRILSVRLKLLEARELAPVDAI